MRHHAEVGRQHLADVALGDEIARVTDARVAASLQPDEATQFAFARQARHLLRLRERGAEWPLAEDRLPGAEARHHEVVVPRHAHRDDNEVDVRACHHVVDVVERQLGAEPCGRGGRRLLMRGADSSELVVGQRL